MMQWHRFYRTRKHRPAALASLEVLGPTDSPYLEVRGPTTRVRLTLRIWNLLNVLTSGVGDVRSRSSLIDPATFKIE